jgi:predicted NBD/HSP70 family sugar kinase
MANHYVAVDVGGTKISPAVVTESGRILVRQKEKTDRRSKKHLIEQIQDTISGVIKTAGMKKTGIAESRWACPVLWNRIADTSFSHPTRH